MFAAFLNLSGRLCTVVGGGEVAARKAASLLRAGAVVRVIAPQLSDEMRAVLLGRQVERLEREYRPGDLRGSVLAFAATDDPEVNASVYREAQELGILVNVADDPAHCSFYVPATVHRDPIAIAISTEGASPALSRHLKKAIEAAVPPFYAHLARLLGELRQEFVAAVPSPEERSLRVERVLNSKVPALLAAGEPDAADRLVREILGLPR